MGIAVKNVGFVGTGIMGLPMAKNLALAGFNVTAYNRSADKAAQLVAHGVAVAPSAAQACKDQDAVVVMLNSGPVCDQVLFAKDDGALWSMKPGSLLIVMSSIPVTSAQAHARYAQAVGVKYLDAPVSGGEVGAKAATLSIMVGGDADDVAVAKPMLEAMGHPIHIGPTGTGQLTKLANQLTVASTIVAVAEALLLAERGGAQVERVREALLGGFAQSRIMDLHGRRMIDGNFKPGGSAVNQLKDTQAAMALAADLGLDLPMLKLTDSLFGDLVEQGQGGLDHSALILELRRRNPLAANALGRAMSRLGVGPGPHAQQTTGSCVDARPLLVVVMGVCGCGKSSLGAALAQRLNSPFLDADDFHPAANKEKMAQCLPLSDADRWPWLDALGHALAIQGQKAGMAVAACSALKRSYRDRLVAVTGGDLRFFLLNGPKSLIAQRLSERADHFMSPALLDSQLSTLELPTAEEPAWTLDISEPLTVLVSQIQEHLLIRKQTTPNDVAVQHE